MDRCAECRRYRIESERLAELLGGLPRVEAPADFYQVLRARISRRQATAVNSGSFQGVYRLFPIAAAALVVAFVALVALYVSRPAVEVGDASESVPAAGSSPEIKAAPAVDPQPQAEVSPPEIGSTDVAAVDSTDGEPETPRAEARQVRPRSAQGVKRGRNPARLPMPAGDRAAPDALEPSGGSRDLGVRPGETINPPGINGNVAEPGPEITTTTDAGEIWKLIGIETTPHRPRTRVISVRPNSVAERSGVKAGDVIEAVDGKPFSGEPFSGTAISVKTIDVVRDGRRINIRLTQDQP